MKQVFLFYLADPIYGGWVTYTSHLYFCLKEQGYHPLLFKIGNKTESRSRDYGNGIQYTNVDPRTAVSMATQAFSVITACGPKHVIYGCELLNAGAKLVIHDPTEMRKELIEAIRSEVITIGAINQQRLAEKGVLSRVVRHPYVPMKSGYFRGGKAISHARIDWDKNTHLIMKANTILPCEKQIAIYGSVNRLYQNLKLTKEFGVGEFEKYYAGKFPKTLHAGAELCLSADFCVDLSVIKGDGGRTQYTFLESFDAGSVLVVHKDWLSSKDPVLTDEENCLSIGTAEELAYKISEDRNGKNQRLIKAAKSLLSEHAPAKICSEFMKK